MANGGVESSAESPEAEELQPTTSSPASATTKGSGLRRWRRIRREQQREGHTPATLAGGASGQGDENAAQLHRRRLPLPANARKLKQPPPRTTAPPRPSSPASSRSRRRCWTGGSLHDRLRVRAGAENSRSRVWSLSSSATKASHLVGRLARSGADSHADVDDTLEEASVRNGQDRGGPHSISGADPYAESVLLLQRTREALENRTVEFSAL
jgi:hypothetical protein